jgi:DNA polymerase (family 10)
MPVHNADIARVFDDIADLLELGDENPFRVRAYRNAARIVGSLGLDIAGTLAAGKPLPKIPGVGADLAGKLAEIVATGTCALLEKLRKQFGPGVAELMRLPGLGPKRVRILHDSLNVHSLAEVATAAESGQIRELPGFGEKTELQILEAARANLSKARRFLLSTAAQYAEPLAAALRAVKGVDRVVIGGSYRRARETVGDIDLVATTTHPADVMERFVRYPEVKTIMAHGDTRATVMLACGLQVDLRVVPPESFGAALHYFTGSKAHNIAIRKLAVAAGLKLNEYGLFARNGRSGETRVGGETEESVFAAVGLPWIPPELREDQGEIEAARRGALPALVELADLQGDLHVHTKASDGHDTVAAMAEAARSRGLKYIAVTDHSRAERIAHGLDPQRLAKQVDEIDRLNAKLRGFRVLKGIEVDILADGTLDLPDGVLATLDIVVASVHSRFDLPRARQTARILRALDNPYVRILGHPTGRLLEEREPYDVDMLRIVRKARERGIALELNAQPQRLDLNDTHCRMAKEEGVLVSIASDAHGTADYDHLREGIGQARRGWLAARDVLNTRPLDELMRWLARAARAPASRRKSAA